VDKLLTMLAALKARPLDQGSAHFQPSTLVVTTVDVGNTATNVIPAEARAGFNIRFNDLHSGRTLEEWLRRTLDAISPDYDVSVEVSGESFLTPPGPLSALVAEAVRHVTGREPDLSTSGGTSDARFIKDYCPVLEFGLVGQSMHKADERVAVADMEALTRIYQRILDGFQAFQAPSC
ncbi:MAG: M20/M25/M40 family metallo-hydrolase, partial [Rhodospirillales bacterium]|nr:M20/M25/M40 family metallo-hydrolase [Rhodospirillales bacterium]